MRNNLRMPGRIEEFFDDRTLLFHCYSQHIGGAKTSIRSDLLLVFDFKSLYTSAMAKCGSIYSEIDCGYDFTFDREDYFVTSYINPAFEFFRTSNNKRWQTGRYNSSTCTNWSKSVENHTIRKVEKKHKLIFFDRCNSKNCLKWCKSNWEIWRNNKGRKLRDENFPRLHLEKVFEKTLENINEASFAKMKLIEKTRAIVHMDKSLKKEDFVEEHCFKGVDRLKKE